MKKLVENFALRAVVIIGAVLITYILFLNFRAGFLKFSPWVFVLSVIFLIIGTGFIFWKRVAIKKLLLKLYHSKKCPIVVIIVCALAIVARISFLAVDYQSATNDPKSFYHNAISLVENDHLVDDSWYDAHYVAFNPYIYNYIYVLKFAMQIFGTSPLAFVVINTTFDLLTAGVIFLFAKKIKNARFALFAMMFWLINPFNITFSAIPLPIVIVNFFIILSIFLAYLAMRNIDNIRRFLTMNCALAVSLGIGNLFRPFMIIFIIAIAILYLFLFLKKSPKYLLICAISLIILYIPIPIFNNFSLNSVKKVTGYEDISIDSSWSMLLGSNLKYGGHWNEEDAAIARKLERDSSMKEAKKEMSKIAIERYLSYNPAQLFELMFKKSVDLAAYPADAVYFEMYNYKNSQIQMILTVFSTIFVIFIQIFSLIAIIRMIKTKKYPLFPIFLLIIFIGLFLSGLLVETMSRYYIPLLTILFMFVVSFTDYKKVLLHN